MIIDILRLNCTVAEGISEELTKGNILFSTSPSSIKYIDFPNVAETAAEQEKWQGKNGNTR